MNIHPSEPDSKHEKTNVVIGKETLCLFEGPQGYDYVVFTEEHPEGVIHASNKSVVEAFSLFSMEIKKRLLPSRPAPSRKRIKRHF